MSFGFRLVKWALLAAAMVALLLLSPATRETIVTTAHAQTQRVLVVNNENRPVPTTPGNEIFQVQVFIGMSGSSAITFKAFLVPAGMRLVLENITGFGAASGIRLVRVTQSGSASAVLLPSTVNADWSWAGTVTTKVVFNPGNVTVVIARSSAPGGTAIAGNYITLTGYLVPI